ncbi:hypothetical protein CXF70_09180 [Planomicrobium sp. MB-3u-38]|nr:hypothetical protein [Planomicrobium sp. MB-3u-38]PKH10546.1 hypothetical protein CXF70_09180 [Planomicrobium sp. MB-3u-38]
MSTEQNSTKERTRLSLLRMQQLVHIEIYNETVMASMVNDLKPASNYFIRPTGKDEEWGFSKTFYKDIQKILAMKSDYKPKVFVTYLNLVGYIFYGASNEPISFIAIDTIAKNTGINRKLLIKYFKALYEDEVLYFIHLNINNSPTKIIVQDGFIKNILLNGQYRLQNIITKLIGANLRVERKGYQKNKRFSFSGFLLNMSMAY